MLDTLTAPSWPYLLALFALAAQWLLSVRREARLGRVPRLAYLAAPGLAALLAAPLLTGGEPLFGLGAALLLIAAYAPAAYRLAPRPAGGAQTNQRRSVYALVVVGFLGAALAQLDLSHVGVGGWPWAVWAGGGLAALGAWLSVAGLPRGPAAPSLPDLALRFSGYSAPGWPDLELRVEGERAWLQNISQGSVRLAGWSFSGENAWIRPRDRQGRPLAPWPDLLPKGSRAGLLAPFGPEGEAGQLVRVMVACGRPNPPRSGAGVPPLIKRLQWG